MSNNPEAGDYISFEPTPEQMRDSHNGLLFLTAELMIETKTNTEIENILQIRAPSYLCEQSVSELRAALNHAYSINRKLKDG